MAVKNIAVTDTLETFRTQFNDLAANDFGDIANLSGSISATNLVDAMNETLSIATSTAGWTITDSSATSQIIGGGETLTVNGTTNQITAVVSGSDILTIGLPNDVTVTGEFTAQGTGTHSLGTIQVVGNTISSSDTSLITVDDSLTVNGTLTVDTISSSSSSVFFGSKHIETLGYIYTKEGLYFEGATSDTYETNLIAQDPTADRTITLPNETGTIITTGSSGVVTSTMIANGTISTDDIADNQISEAKMADDAIGQDQLKNVVTLQILNSSGVVVKTIYGAGA
jgi:hypothetical protein